MAEEKHSVEAAYDVADEYRPEPPPPPSPPAWMDGSIRIGIHTSIAGDIVQALEIAHGLGANALQIFSSSPRMWGRAFGGTRIGAADAARFRERREQLGLGPVVIHDNYLINLASPERVLRTRSVQAFHEELVRAMSLDADFLVAHPGSARGVDSRAATSAIAEGIRQAARGLKLAERPRILLENTAGQGTSIGSRFEELKTILEACPELPLGVCIDTAHLFEAGHDLRTMEGVEAVLEEIDRTVGLGQVCVVHVNDSKTALGLRADRHEHIGKGKIGLEAFGRILNHPLLAGRPFILETPIDKPGDDRRNVRTLWKLVGIDVKVPRTRDGFRVKRRRPRLRRKAGWRRKPVKSKARGK